MSQGENLNANGAILSQEIVRMGFHRFPQSEIAQVGSELWPQIAPLLMAQGYPFQAVENPDIPPGEVWFEDRAKTLLGRIINLKVDAAPLVITQNDAMNFIDEETKPDKVKKQRERRVKDKLL